MSTQTVLTNFVNQAGPIDLVALGGGPTSSIQIVLDDVPSAATPYPFSITFEVTKLCTPVIVSYAWPYYGAVTDGADVKTFVASGARNDPKALAMMIRRRMEPGIMRTGTDASVLAPLDAYVNLDELLVSNLQATLTMSVQATRVLGGVGSMHLVVTW